MQRVTAKNFALTTKQNIEETNDVDTRENTNTEYNITVYCTFRYADFACYDRISRKKISTFVAKFFLFTSEACLEVTDLTQGKLERSIARQIMCKICCGSHDSADIFRSFITALRWRGLVYTRPKVPTREHRLSEGSGRD